MKSYGVTIQMKATEQYFPVVFFQMKATEQYFHMVLFLFRHFTK